MSATRPRVGLFVTCLVDLFRPSVGFAAVKLLEQRLRRLPSPEPAVSGSGSLGPSPKTPRNHGVLGPDPRSGLAVSEDAD